MTDIHTLIQDKGGKSIRIYDYVLVAHIKRYFRWRKDVDIKRLQTNTSTTQYDGFIEYLIRMDAGITL